MIKLKNFVFGHFETYEGDPFYWIADLATLCTRTLRHKTITRVIFWFYNIALFFMLTSVLLTKNPGDLFANNLVIFSLLLMLIITYGNTMRKFRMVNKMFQTVIKLIIYNKSTANISLKNEMLETSKNWKYALLTLQLIVTPIAYYLYAFFQTSEEAIPNIIIKKITLNRSYLFQSLKILMLYLMPFHACIFVGTPIYTIIYCSRHIKYLLKYVVQEMKNFQQNEDELEMNIMECLGSNKYQQKVKNELIYCINQINAIKKAADYVNHCLKWRFLSIFIVAGLVAALNLVFIMQVELKSRICQAGFVCSILVYTVFAAESGEQVETECESIYIQAQQFNWYKYNKGNCQLLFMLLMQTREPLQLKCYDMVILNRIMILTFYQRVYSFISIFGTR